MIRETTVWLAAAIWLALGISISQAQTTVSLEQAEFFEKKIRPVLIDSCYECHSKEAGQKKGGLSLDTRFGMQTGGNSGPGVVPGDLEQSWVWLAVSHSEPDYEMPPKSKLQPEVIADFKRWIEMGAPDPREGEKEVTTEIDIEKGKQFWSFQSPTRQRAPNVADSEWARTEIDQFIRAKLDTKKLLPAPLADGHAMLRRLCYDLIGMPPTQEFTGRFLAAWEQDPNHAIISAVDQLMSSRQFGERWGKHWLDLARYAESNGQGANQSYPHAWRYRDYVIDSINADKPINQFVIEQLAGDLLPAESEADRQENLIATGFLALGPKPLREKSRRQFTMDVIDEQIDTLSKTFLGLTVSCARCHDHKFDPIPTSDYYAIAGILLSSETNYGTAGNNGRFNQSSLIELPLKSEIGTKFSKEEVDKLERELAKVNEALRNFHDEKRERMQGEATEPKEKRNSARNFRTRQTQIQDTLEKINTSGAIKAFAMGMTDRPEPMDTSILVRGEIDSPAQTVPRGFLQVMDHATSAIGAETSGRLEMAQWIASGRNPLTARVFVNRVWEKLFGEGLVNTLDNFGTTGQAPTHPELLDHLAIQLMENGWSMKQLIRSLVLTRTYRSSSDFHAGNDAIDPTNQYLWRATPRRLDGDAFRDTILAVTGELDLSRPVRSPVADYGLGELGRKSSPDLLANFPPNRSVYLPPIRDAMPEIIEVFDGADPDISTAKREVSNGAEQSLFLMNSPFIAKQADKFARRLRDQHDQLEEQVKGAFLQTYGRHPTEGEYNSAIEFYQTYLPTVKDKTSKADAQAQFLKLFCQGLLCSAELRYLR